MAQQCSSRQGQAGWLAGFTGRVNSGEGCRPATRFTYFFPPHQRTQPSTSACLGVQGVEHERHADKVVGRVGGQVLSEAADGRVELAGAAAQQVVPAGRGSQRYGGWQKVEQEGGRAELAS